jgi:hypothetical protein
MMWKETFKREGGGGRFGRGRQGRAWENVSESGVAEQQAELHGEEQAQDPHREAGTGLGMGQKTLKQFCEEEGIELPWAVARLKYKGFLVRETMTMREIAGSKGVHPRELRDILQKGH